MHLTAEQLLRTMRAALAEEREGIRSLDAEAVLRATIAKEQIVEVIRTMPKEEQTPLLRALAELKNDLRSNLVLLAHARDYLRDAVELCRGATHNDGRLGRLEAKL